MMLKCSFCRKNLSAFLDGELDPQERRQVELHISDCADCRREMERLRKMVRLVGGMERPEVPAQLWEATQRKLATSSDQPIRIWVFRKPVWAIAPAAAAVLMMLLYFAGGQLFFSGYKAETIPVTVYLEEYALSYSEQILSPDLLPELTIVQTQESEVGTTSDESMSELDMLMEVHYGTNPTNGS